MKRFIRLLVMTLCLLLIASTASALPENYVVRHGDRDQKKVSITVDDGWDLSILREIHELSVELDFPITWFMVGTQFRHEDKALWEDVIAHGSEIGNHTWKHSRLLRFNISNGHPQTRLTQERVDEVLGYHYPLRLMRPPYGEYKNAEKNFLPIFEKYGVEKVVLWDVSQTNPQKAIKDVQNGSILLYHTRKADLECLKVLVPMLREQGYELVTVSDLLGMPPLELPPEAYTPAPAITEGPVATEAPAADATLVPTEAPTAAPTVTPKPTATPKPTPTVKPTATPKATPIYKSPDYVVRNGDRSVKKISITVDDGWDLDYLRKIHELSVEMDFPITWFMVGTQFLHEDKALWEEILAHGSEIGNHTWKHSRLLKFSTSNGHTLMRLMLERVDEVLGYHYPLRLMRPPYGEYKNNEKNFLPVFAQYGVEKVVLWDVSQTDPQKAFKDTQNGSILLYHARQADYECLQVLVPMLKDAGFELVTVSDLLGLEPLVLDMPADSLQ